LVLSFTRVPPIVMIVLFGAIGAFIPW
jgi:hypothetical protein